MYGRSALHKLFLLQRSACAGIEPGTSRRMMATPFVQLTADCVQMSCRAAATLTSYGDEKALFPAVSKVRSSGCVRWGRVKSGSSRKKKWKHARLQGAQRREGVCVGLGCRGAECDYADFLRCRPRVFGTFGNGAPPQAHIHLNLEVYISGSPPAKFGPKCNGL